METKIERMKKLLKRDFGIETMEQFKEAVENIDLDLGIFVTPVEEVLKHVS